MPEFGFSAFLKVICSSPRVQRSLIRARLAPSGDGYDFHRSLRLRAGQILLGGGLAADVLASVSAIVNPHEQAATRAGLTRLISWREEHPRPILAASPVVYESPNATFRVRYTPDFGMQFGERATAIHVWNTKSPELEARQVYSALSLVMPLYAGISGAPTDVAVLSLRTNRLYRLSTVTDYSAAGARLADRLEDIFDEIAEELRLPTTGRRLPPPGP